MSIHALAITLAGSCALVVYPYRIVRPGEVVVAEPFATPGSDDVFSSR